MSSGADAEKARAARRYAVMNVVRIGSLVTVIIGIAIARAVIAAPYALGVALAAIGLFGFFFVPPLLAKRWKAGDRAE